jgi:hypothetical protein
MKIIITEITKNSKNVNKVKVKNRLQKLPNWVKV